MMPTASGDTSPAVTATMTSSNNATPAAVCPDRMQGLADAEPAERHQVRESPKRSPIRAACVEGGVRRRGVARQHASAARASTSRYPRSTQSCRPSSEQPLAPGEPAAAARRLALDQQGEAEPERAARRPRGRRPG